MPHWYRSDITPDKLRQKFPWMTEEKFTVQVTFKDLNWRGNCGFLVTIKERNGYNIMTVNLAEQPGCCGYGNIFYPTYGALGWCHKYENVYEMYLDVATYCARLLNLAGIQFVGTSHTDLFKEMTKRGWKTVHKMYNPRYRQEGTTLTVMCKKLNVFRNGKPLNPRIKTSIYD